MEALHSEIHILKSNINNWLYKTEPPSLQKFLSVVMGDASRHDMWRAVEFVDAVVSDRQFIKFLKIQEINNK